MRTYKENVTELDKDETLVIRRSYTGSAPSEIYVINGPGGFIIRTGIADVELTTIEMEEDGSTIHGPFARISTIDINHKL